MGGLGPAGAEPGWSGRGPGSAGNRGREMSKAERRPLERSPSVALGPVEARPLAARSDSAGCMVLEAGWRCWLGCGMMSSVESD